MSKYNGINQALGKLARSIKLKFLLPSNRPTLEELTLIIKDISSLEEYERTDEAWRDIVYRHVKFEGTYLYKGLDHSDINFLLNQVLSILEENG